MLLISISSLIIIFYSYIKSYQSILKLSDSVIDQVSLTLLEKIDDITHQALLLTELTKGKILSETNSIIIDEELVPFLITVLKNAPLVYSINIATGR